MPCVLRSVVPRQMTCCGEVGTSYAGSPPGLMPGCLPPWDSFHPVLLALRNNFIYQRGTPALHLNEAADGSCCDAGLGLVWRCHWIYMSFVCLIQKNICFGFLKGRGCVESKNKTSAKRKSTMSSLDPSIIQVASFKCRADVPLAQQTVAGVQWLWQRKYWI